MRKRWLVATYRHDPIEGIPGVEVHSEHWTRRGAIEAMSALVAQLSIRAVVAPSDYPSFVAVWHRKALEEFVEGLQGEWEVD